MEIMAQTCYIYNVASLFVFDDNLGNWICWNRHRESYKLDNHFVPNYRKQRYFDTFFI